MELFTNQNLAPLLATREGHCVSLFLTPDQQASSHFNAVHLESLLSVAEAELSQRGEEPDTIESFLKPARRFLHDAADWVHPFDGLAVFLAADYCAAYGMPQPVRETVIVAPQFFIRPLLPMLYDDGRFAILALSHNCVRLFEASRYNIREVALDDVPAGLAEAMQYVDAERRLRLGADGPGIFHGHACAHEDDKENMQQFFRKIDARVADFLSDRDLPLVLAGVAYLLPLYREINSHPGLLDDGVFGCPDHLSYTVLHAKAWPIAAHVFDAPRRQALAQYREQAERGAAPHGVRRVLPAACGGRVASLLLGDPVARWGRWDPANFSITVHAEPQKGDEELVNRAAIETLKNGGQVFEVGAHEVQSATEVAAALRY